MKRQRESGASFTPFFRLLADGYVYAGTPDVKRNEVQKFPVAMVQREEHDGTRRYILEDEATVRICGEKIDKQIPREDFAAVAELVFAAVKESRENDVMSPDGVEEFLDEVAIYDLEAKTDDRTDFYVAFYGIEAPLVGFCVRSRLGTMFPLLDGGRAANLKFEQTGVKFATPTVNKINAFGEEDDVTGRMLMIERLGGILKYNDVADKVFRSNLCMIDLHFPRMLGEMLRVMHLDGISKVSDLIEAIKQINPNIIVIQGAGNRTADDQYNAIKNGSEGSGASSGIFLAEDPKTKIKELLEGVIRARDEFGTKVYNGD